ncbi:hypothetical protein Tco_0809456 [Tanacetum coccineum]
MDGRGMGSCVELFFVPSGFLVSPSVKLLVAGRSGVGKGGSRVLIPDLVVMARVSASASGVLLLSIAKRIWEYCSRNPLRCWTSMYHHSDRILEGKDHCRYLLQTSTPARMGYSAHIHWPHKILYSNRKSVGGILSSHSAAFPLREKWKNLNLDVSRMASSAYVARVNDSFGLFGWKGDWILETEGCSVRMFMQGLLHEKFYNSLGSAPNRCGVVWARLKVVYRSLEE